MSEIDLKQLQALIEEGEPLVVDFSAEWCAPCKALEPVLNDLAREFEGRVKVVSCDVEQHDDIATKYAIRNVPSLLFFRHGKMTAREVGAFPKQVLHEKFSVLLQG